MKPQKKKGKPKPMVKKAKVANPAAKPKAAEKPAEIKAAAPVVEPPKPVEAGPKPKLVKGAKVKPPAPPAPPPAAAPSEGETINKNKRITAGAAVKEWRAVRSLRKALPGFFAQGGHYKTTGRGKEFIVGDERLFATMKEAQEFCKKAQAPTATVQ